MKKFIEFFILNLNILLLKNKIILIYVIYIIFIFEK